MKRYTKISVLILVAALCISATGLARHNTYTYYNINKVYESKKKKKAKVNATALTKEDSLMQLSIYELYELATDTFKVDPEEGYKYFELVTQHKQKEDHVKGDAYTQMGLCLKDGKGVKTNQNKAALYFKKAAMVPFENPTAQCEYGYLLEVGKNGVSKNLEDAHEMYLSAARKGNVKAIYNMGYLCRAEKSANGMEKAFHWFYVAAELGNEDAQVMVGNGYLNGEGVAQNYDKAKQWYEKAAWKNHANVEKKPENITNGYAAYNLGLIYENGFGSTEMDPTKAIKYYNQAKKLGRKNIEQDIERCRAKLAEQMNSLQK